MLCAACKKEALRHLFTCTMTMRVEQFNAGELRFGCEWLNERLHWSLFAQGLGAVFGFSNDGTCIYTPPSAFIEIPRLLDKRAQPAQDRTSRMDSMSRNDSSSQEESLECPSRSDG